MSNNSYQLREKESHLLPYEVVVYPVHTYSSQGQPYGLSGGGVSPSHGDYPPTGGSHSRVGGGHPHAGGGYPPSDRHPGGGGNPTSNPRQVTIGMPLVDVYNYEYGPTRNFFVRRVFLLLSMMLAFTAIYVLLCMNVDSVKIFLINNPWLRMFGSILFLVSAMAIGCCPITRAVPWNYIVLVLCVVGMSILCGSMSVMFKSWAVFMAFAILCALCLFLTALACTSFDFTRFILFVVVLGLVFFLLAIAFMLVTLFFKYIKPMHMLLAGGFVFLNSMMFVIQLQMILGGRALELEPHEFVYGAFVLYTSIMQMFLNILMLMGLIDA